MSYGVFARFYDSLTDDVERDMIAHFIDDAVERFGTRGTLVDLGCGTGAMLPAYDGMGYDVIGVDLSEDMLAAAYDNIMDAGKSIQLVCQDMTELELGFEADVFVCVLDGICHLPDRDGIARAFERIAMWSHEGTLFIFDMNTPYKHTHILSGQTFVYDTDDVYCVWQNSEEDDTDGDHRIDMLLDLFEPDGDVYRRYEDELSEIAPDPDIVDDMLTQAGFEILGSYDGYTDRPVTDTTERIVRICRCGTRR